MKRKTTHSSPEDVVRVRNGRSRCLSLPPIPQTSQIPLRPRQQRIARTPDTRGEFQEAAEGVQDTSKLAPTLFTSSSTARDTAVQSTAQASPSQDQASLEESANDTEDDNGTTVAEVGSQSDAETQDRGSGVYEFRGVSTTRSMPSITVDVPHLLLDGPQAGQHQVEMHEDSGIDINSDETNNTAHHHVSNSNDSKFDHTSLSLVI